MVRSYRSVISSIIFIWVSSLVCSAADRYTISGIVRDGSIKDPLTCANILIEGTATGTSTDVQGKFSLEVSPGTYTLRCSLVGYKASFTEILVQKNSWLVLELSSLDLCLQDVTVYSMQSSAVVQEEVSALTLQSEAIKQSTSVMADVLRSVQMLPGVSSNNEMSAKFDVHGGDANENLVLINGSQVYEPYHVKEAPNVSIGIFDVDMIKTMDLITGGYSARYGDRMSSVLNIEYREGSKERLQGQVNASMTDFSGLCEGPIGENGSFIVGARQSYLQYIKDMIGVAKEIHPAFYDVQGVLAYQLAPQHKLSLKFIHAGDSFSRDPIVNGWSSYNPAYHDGSGLIGPLSVSQSDSTEVHAQYYSSMAALQSTDVLSSDVLLKMEVSYYDQRESEHSGELEPYASHFRSGSVNGFYRSVYDRSYNSNLRIQTLEFNSSVEIQASSFLGIRTGANYLPIFYDRKYSDRRMYTELTNYDYKTNRYPDTLHTLQDFSPPATNLDSVHTHSYKLGGYVENVLQLGEHVILNIGGRVDYFDLNKDVTWSPRILSAYKIDDALTLRGAWGYYYQSPVPDQLSFSAASDTNTQSQRAIHYTLGMEYNRILNTETHSFLKLKIDGIYKTYDNLISAIFSTYNENLQYSKKNDAVGRAKGLDVFVMYSEPGFSGWLSYSWLNAEQRMIVDTLGYFPRGTDQRHTIASVATIDLGNTWDLSLRLTYGSGYPYTPSIAVYDNSKKQWNWIVSKPNSATMPAYRRVDVRVSKDFTIIGLSASAFLDVSNVFNFNNIQTYNYTFDTHGQPTVEEIRLWPILPTLGMAIKF
jgi:outer membrane receptor protein involved in Fe transport